MHSHTPSVSLSLSPTHTHIFRAAPVPATSSSFWSYYSPPAPPLCRLPLASNQIYGSSMTLASFYFIFFLLLFRLPCFTIFTFTTSHLLLSLHSTPPALSLAAASVSWHCFCAAPPTGFWLIALTLAFALALLSLTALLPLSHRSLLRHAHVAVLALSSLSRTVQRCEWWRPENVNAAVQQLRRQHRLQLRLRLWLVCCCPIRQEWKRQKLIDITRTPAASSAACWLTVNMHTFSPLSHTLFLFLYVCMCVLPAFLCSL